MIALGHTHAACASPRDRRGAGHVLGNNAMRRVLGLIGLVGLLFPQVHLIVPHHHHVVQDGGAVRTETHYFRHGIGHKGAGDEAPETPEARPTSCEEAPHPEAVKEEPKAKSKVFLSAILQDRRLEVPRWVKPARRVSIPTSDHAPGSTRPRDCLGRAPPSA